MTSHDVRDMLDLPGEAPPRPAKKQKLAGPRPVLKGLAREVQNLSGDNSIAIVPEVTIFKKKRFGSRKPAAKWELKPFKNSARLDGNLVLKHWRKKLDVVTIATGEDAKMEQVEPVIEDSTFAKFSVQVNTPKYTDEQFTSHLESEDWSKDETDYLINLAQEFDLRWPVIWDRYEYQFPTPQPSQESPEGSLLLVPKDRSLEDLKSRYYKVASTILRLQKPVETMKQNEFNFLELMESYNGESEKARKRYAESSLGRTKEEAREEESLLTELKRILSRSEKLSEERRELYSRLDAPASAGNIGIYTSSQGLSSLVSQLAAVDKSKRKLLLGRDGISPVGPSSLGQPSGFERRDSITRESISGPSGGNKKGSMQGQPDRRQMTAEEEILYGIKHFDRITSAGPAFRHEKINKPITSKSAIQQQKIHNVLTELRIPARLFMPTHRVGEAFENLVLNILSLIEQRKVADKLQGEINLVKQIRAEKEKAARREHGEPENAESEEGGKVKVEDQDAREKSAAPSIRTGSMHKRSASVLSTVSDKSTKRQKK